MPSLNIPRHVAVIMDGNGRWAKKRLMPRSFGHKSGMDAMIKLAECAQDCGVKYLTVYVLSTENFKRPKEEIEALFELIRKYFTENVKKLYARGAKIRIIGDLSILPEDIRKTLEESQKTMPETAEFTLVFAINYGSRSEILKAVNRAVEGGKAVDEEQFANYLYTADIPDPDLIIRTGGEKRLSNFLVYQAAYAELYFTNVYFPDFNKRQFLKALEEYSKRERRFGNI